MTGETYVLPKINEKKTAKKKEATLQEVKEEEDETENEEKTEEKQDPMPQSKGKRLECLACARQCTVM